MEITFLEAIEKRVILADGAMGTEIYSRGFFLNRCYDELNLTNSDIIYDIHAQYAKAGSEILTSNTFGGNRIHLKSYGLADNTEAINKKGIELARDVAGDSIYVAGSIGPIPRKLTRNENESAIRDSFREQANIILEAGVDLIILETFSTLEQLEVAYSTIRELDDSIAIIPSISIGLFSKHKPVSPSELVQKAKQWNSPILGLNCGGGPPEMLEVLSRVKKAAGDDIKISAMPNAGFPQEVEGRTLYLASPEYLAEYARRLVQKGASVIGGCCGTTPNMIKEMSSFLRSIQPGMTSVSVVHEIPPEESMEPVSIEERTPFGKILGQKFAISVELDPPKGLDAAKSVQGAKFLYGNGIDAVNIADGPRAIGRMSPTALALLVQREVPIQTIIHVCCRDRNLLALQMDLVSANALGLKNLMLITGDPPKMGIFPDATAVFDLDAIGLISGANKLNHGLDFADKRLKSQTSFVIGVGCNPGATDLDLEVSRYEQKVEAGAEFVFSQPVYDTELLINFLNRIKHVKPIPFFVGILPLASSKNAEFLHNNVPGMQVPDDIRKRMSVAPTKDAQREEGINIAAEALKEAKEQPAIKGAYVFPPFGRYESILDVLEKAGVR